MLHSRVPAPRPFGLARISGVKTSVNLAYASESFTVVLTMDATSLHRTEREKLRDGRLTLTGITQVRGRPGAGQACAACEETVTNAALAMEITWASNEPAYFHVGCFHVWDEERRAPDLGQSSAP